MQTRQDVIAKMNALSASIEKIGEPSENFIYKSKKISEDLKKHKLELMEQAFGDAFEPHRGE